MELKIGELAKKTGLSVGSLRYYSDLGLLHPVVRGDNRYRYYNLKTIHEVEFIKKAQAIGFSLQEIKQILDVRDRGEIPCDLVKELLNSKIEELELQIERMTIFKSELEEYRNQWQNHNNSENSTEICPLISTVKMKKEKI